MNRERIDYDPVSISMVITFDRTQLHYTPYMYNTLVRRLDLDPSSLNNTVTRGMATVATMTSEPTSITEVTWTIKQPLLKMQFRKSDTMEINATLPLKVTTISLRTLSMISN